MEQRLFGRQLSEDGAGAPHVNRRGVARRTQEDLRGAVPQRHHLDNNKPGRGGTVMNAQTQSTD